MKKYICFIVMLLSFIVASAQEEKQIHIMRNDGGMNIIPQSEVDSITFSSIDIDGKNSNLEGTQILYTKNKEYYIPIEVINEVSFNMQKEVEKNFYYTIESTSEESEWDSLMVTSNGYCAAIKTDSNSVITIAIDAIGSIDNTNSVIAQLNPDLTPISIIADDKVFYFVNYRDNIVDIITVENGEATLRTDVNLTTFPNNVRRRAGEGVSQNHYADVVSKLNSAYNIVQGGAQGAAEATMTGIDLATQNGANAESKFVLSLSGLGLTAGVGLLAGLTWPELLAGALIGGGISIWKYIEDKFNENKVQSYRLFAGNCEVETLAPEKVSYNSYRIGVKVKNSNTIPSAYKGYNTYGLIFKKVRLDNTPPPCIKPL